MGWMYDSLNPRYSHETSHEWAFISYHSKFMCLLHRYSVFQDCGKLNVTLHRQLSNKEKCSQQSLENKNKRNHKSCLQTEISNIKWHLIFTFNDSPLDTKSRSIPFSVYSRLEDWDLWTIIVYEYAIGFLFTSEGRVLWISDWDINECLWLWCFIEYLIKLQKRRSR